MRFRTVALFVLAALVSSAGLLAAQAPTPEAVGAELGALAVVGLGALGSLLEQGAKRIVAPFDNASAVVKGVVTLAWGFGLAWLGGRLPWLAAALPSDPGALGTAVNGLLLTLVMMGAHSVKKIVQKPEATGQELP